jgi:hypothetical protein
MSVKGPLEWPHLESLYGGYLHQDFAVEHGSASRAVQAWLAEASPTDAMALSSEWRTFLNVTHGMDATARGSWSADRGRRRATASSRSSPRC